MKNKLIMSLVIFLGFAVVFSFCTKEKNDGDVPYRACLCEEEQASSNFQISRLDAYLFRDSVPEQMMEKIHTEHSNGSRVCWILFDSKSEHTSIEILNPSSISSYGRICNFPDFAKQWSIPKNGCMVVFEGMTYEACWGGLANRTYFDLILTNLKRK